LLQKKQISDPQNDGIEGLYYGFELPQTMNEKSNGYWNPSYGIIYCALNRMKKWIHRESPQRTRG